MTANAIEVSLCEAHAVECKRLGGVLVVRAPAFSCEWGHAPSSTLLACHERAVEIVGMNEAALLAFEKAHPPDRPALNGGIGDTAELDPPPEPFVEPSVGREILEPDTRPDHERMVIRSQTPELDSIFVPAIDFPGTVVRPGQLHERSFAFARECRIRAIRFPKGFECQRIVLRVGPRFRPVREDGQEVGRYEGEDARIYEGADEVRKGEWKNHRLVPELGGFLYVLVRNMTKDDLKFEGTILLQEDRVPTPEHEEL